MTKVRTFFTMAMKEWWPASDDPEDIEPAMPSEVFFKREINLYSDFSDYDQRWITPEPDGQRYKFRNESLHINPIDECHTLLKRLVDTRNSGLFEPGVLSVVNTSFKKYYIKETTSTDKLTEIYDNVAQKIQSVHNIPVSVFYKSSLYEWPLYHFLVDKKYTPWF
jgi:hypothetical protein